MWEFTHFWHCLKLDILNIYHIWHLFLSDLDWQQPTQALFIDILSKILRHFYQCSTSCCGERRYDGAGFYQKFEEELWKSVSCHQTQTTNATELHLSWAAWVAINTSDLDVEGGCHLTRSSMVCKQWEEIGCLWVCSAMSISQMTQFTNVSSGINKIMEPSVNTELGEIKNKWARSRWFHRWAVQSKQQEFKWLFHFVKV